MRVAWKGCKMSVHAVLRPTLPSAPMDLFAYCCTADATMGKQFLSWKKNMFHKIRYRLAFNRAGRLNCRGEGLIQIECSQNGHKIYFSTHTYVPPDRFLRGHVTGENAEALNYTLYSMIHEIEKIELEHVRLGKDMSLAALKSAVRVKEGPAAAFMDFGMEAVEGGRRSSGTVANYRTLLKDVCMFRKGTLLAEIDYSFIAGYDKWLRNRGMKHNTRVSRLRMFRALMGEAEKRGIIGKNPFSLFRIPGTRPKTGYLTVEQMNVLKSLELCGREETVRDAFLFGCCTGLRFSDIVSLKQSDMDGGWLKKKMKKTGRYVEIPMSLLFGGLAMEIVGKYGGRIESMAGRMGSNQSVNRILKRLFARCGIPSEYTFHTSRHTCATLLGNSGVDISVVQKILGHARLQTTAVYRETDRASIEAVLLPERVADLRRR